MADRTNHSWFLTEFIRTALELARKRRAERMDQRAKYQAALAFNRIWAYRPYPAATRWMCPTCNRVHERLAEISGFTGLQYPRCCGFPEGHRLYDIPHATTGATRG